MMVAGFSTLLLPAISDALHPALATFAEGEGAGEAQARPGQRLASQGVGKKHPMVFIPGITSTGLEVWEAQPCMQSHFRERVWGGPVMLRKLLTNNACWLRHMLLNETTGMDPRGVKLRPALGIGAADVMMQAYSLWGPLVRNLADLGYDANSIHMASYDWRLAPWDLQRRDSYFSLLKVHIELMVRVNGGHGAVIVAHSMGGNVLQYFLQWVHSPQAEGVGASMPCEAGRVSGNSSFAGQPCSDPLVAGGWWAETYLHSVAYLACPMLGVPKTVATLLSGETREVVSMPPLLRAVKNSVLSDKDTRRLFRSMSSLTTMLPLGGDAVWGKPLGAPQQLAAFNRSVPCACQQEEAGQMPLPVSLQAGWDADICTAVCAGDLPPDAAVAAGVARPSGLHESGARSSWVGVESQWAAPDQVPGHADYGSMLTVLSRDYSPEDDSSSSVAATSRALRQLALRVQNDTREMAAALQETLKSQHRLWSGEDTGPPEPPSDDLPTKHDLPPAPPSPTLRDNLSAACVKYVRPPSEEEVDGVPFNLTAELLACDERIRMGHVLGTPLPMDWHLFDVEGVDEPPRRVVPLPSADQQVDPSTRPWDGVYVDTPHGAQYSAEGVLRLLAAQSPRFMHKALSNIALTATAVPDLDRLAAATATQASAGFNLEDAWLTAHVSREDFHQYTPSSKPEAWRRSAGGLPHPYWMNPLSVPLPAAPSLKFYAMYGVGQLAERGYVFEGAWSLCPGALPPLPATRGTRSLFTGIQAEPSTKWHTAAVLAKEVSIANNGSASLNSTRQGLPARVVYPLHVAPAAHAPAAGISSGVLQSSGDSAVPLASLGYMCNKGWQRPELNPANISCVTREYCVEPEAKQAEPASAEGGAFATWLREMGSGVAQGSAGQVLSSTQRLLTSLRAASSTALAGALSQFAYAVSQEGLLRGGVDMLRSGSAEAGDHIDVLLNRQLLEDILLIASGRRDTLQSHVGHRTEVLSSRLAARLDAANAARGS